MPVRSLHTSVLKWPDRDTVDAAARAWAAAAAAVRPDLQRLGYFGSYATGDWGVGSDLDLVAVVERSDLPFVARGRSWDLTGLPVPAEILVFTAREWDAVVARGDRFARVMSTGVRWIWPLPPAAP
ncbi:MAG: nucleotidyltransferase domain-containing protein [Krumholzibacteria bacterium]|nr:nucleotidyltransferase domain-containing protein [Candidatus Krumholzibacteria bacterium]